MMSGERLTQGAVYVEFLIVIIPLLILMFSLVQMSLFLGAGILTHLAAQRAARSAMVILGDDHEDAESEYEPPELFRVGNDAKGVKAYEDAAENSRYETIRLAARAPLLPVSPTLHAALSSSVEEAFSNVGALELAADILLNEGWTSHAVGLGFINPDGAYLSVVRPRDNARVRVVFLYPCFIPIGREFACHPYRKLPKEHRELIEVHSSGGLLNVSELAGWRFVTLLAEAPIPIWDR
jgi:hypothetical protein